MVFSSLLFLYIFLPIVLALYFITPKPAKNLVLFICSLIFYAWGEPVYVFLLLFSTVADYGFGRFVSYYAKNGQAVHAKLVLFFSLVCNILIICFFKYADFLVLNLNHLPMFSIEPLNLPLPIGISFYTFQSMSYVIDVYRGKVDVQKNILAYGTYVSLFPQLIAGPIVRYETVENELKNRTHSPALFAEGVRRFTIGLAKKVLLANNIGMLWDTICVQDPHTLPALTAWLGILAFTFQIYFDFSGYSDMAIGLGKMFGFHFLENFNYPYISKSITEFWRRWHMSLSSWFKEYVYIPLGGNRKGLTCQLRNILIVWLLTGLWHGASWNFVFWGAYFGMILTVEKIFLLKALEKCPAFIRHLYTMLLVTISWVIFAFDSAQSGTSYMKAIFGLYGAPLYTPESIYYLYTNAILLIILALGSTTLPKRAAAALMKSINSDADDSADKNDMGINKYPAVKIIRKASPIMIEVTFLLFLFTLSTAYLVNSSYNPFLYFRF